MKSGRIVCLLLCSGLASLLAAQPAPQDQGGDHEKRGPSRPPMVAPFGIADRGPSSMRQPPIMMDIAELKSLLRELNVARSTTDNVIEITRNFLSQLDGKLIKIQREELNIREELLKDKPDLPAIQVCIDRKTRIFAEIEFSQIKRDIEIKSLMTRDEYDALKSAMMKKMKHLRPFADEAADKPYDRKPVKPR